MPTPLTIFVTGGTGFIGRHLCARLISQGHAIRALTRKRSDAWLEGLGVQLVSGDLLDEKSYAPALAGCDVVIHLGGNPNFGNGPEYEAVNNQATSRLLAAIRREAGVCRFVFVSSLAAVDRAAEDDCVGPVDEQTPPHPTTDYGRSKLAAEQAVHQAPVSWCIVRPALVIGDGMRPQSHVAQFVRQSLQGSPLSFGNFPGRMSLIHVSDLVDALILAASHPDAHRRVFFAAGEPATLGQVFRWAHPARGRLPCAWLKFLLRPVQRFLPFKVKALLWDVLTASDASLRALGWSPRFTAAQSVAEVVHYEQRRRRLQSPVLGWTLVTGAASGLGAALAEQLARLGRRLILVDKNSAGLNQVVPENQEALRLVCDLSRDEDLERLLGQSFWCEDRVDEVFACAGFGARGPAAELSGEVQANIFKVNVLARVRLCRQAAALMSGRHFGRLVLISSSSAFQPLPYMAAYAASNAALLSYGEALAAELADSAVRVLVVCPGGMATNFQRHAGVKVLAGERLDSPDHVAQRILHALDGHQNTLMVGLRSKGMSFCARLLPRSWNVRLWKRLMSRLR